MVYLLRLVAGLLLAVVLLVQDVGPARASPEPAGAMPKADLVVVYKSARRMDLMAGSRVIRSYRVALGRNPVGDKLIRGDGRTPEGVYSIDARNDHSRYHLSLRISYPHSQQGPPRRFYEAADPGGDIFIHGLPNDRTAAMIDHPRNDWTDGCIAVNNQQMDEIWQAVDLGTLVIIMP